MSFLVVRLSSVRGAGEGLRIGYPPRGVSRAARAADDWCDVWYPSLVPSAETLRAFRGMRDALVWCAVERRYRRAMATSDNRRMLVLRAALSHHTNFPVGCYCADAARCHRRILRELLLAAGALPA
jgi:uncharacterized protein YeaO (DUF488 family)